jgi:DNA-binding beta-propeller fold protein YncE
MKLNRTIAGLLAAVGLITGCDGGDDDTTDDTTMQQALGACGMDQNYELWVPRQEANNIQIVNKDLTLGPTIDLAPTGLKNPHGLTFNKDGTRAVVAMLGTPGGMGVIPYIDGGVVIIDTANKTIISSVVSRAKTHQAVFAPSGQIWAVNVNAPGTVTFIDVATATTAGSLEVGGQAVAVRFSSDGTKGYLTNQFVDGDTSRVDVINVMSKTIDGSPYRTGKATVTPAMTSDGKTLFTTSGMDNRVDKIDLTAADRTAAVSVFASDVSEAHAIGLGKDHLVVTARMGGSVKIFDRAGVLAKDIPVSVAMGNPIPDMVAMSPDCNTAFVTERNEGKVVVIDMATMAIKQTVALDGGYTHGITLLKK